MIWVKKGEANRESPEKSGICPYSITKKQTGYPVCLKNFNSPTVPCVGLIFTCICRWVFSHAFYISPGHINGGRMRRARSPNSRIKSVGK